MKLIFRLYYKIINNYNKESKIKIYKNYKTILYNFYEILKLMINTIILTLV